MSEVDNGFNESIEKYLNKIIDEGREIGISEVYTELSANKILPIILKFRDEKSDKTQEFEVLELVEKEEKLIISGESGSGKTITLKWLNFIYATNYLEIKEGNIPLYVELNTYIEGSFYDYVKIKANRKGISEDILKIMLRGKAIIFLDGIDLLSSKDDFYPNDHISNFISIYSNCRFVISSRLGFFESIKSDFKVSELEKLTDEKIKEFINKYVSDRKLREILTNKILNDKQLKSILTTPMILYLAIEVVMERRKDNIQELFPSNRSEMYEAFISGLFSHYETKKGKNPRDRAQIENALKDLYFYLQCRNEVSCKYSDAQEIVQKHALDPKFKKTTSQDILDDSIKLGLLTRKYSEIEYGIHQSFQEYFAAIKLKELFESGFDVSKAFNHPKWEEVVIFTSEMMSLDSIDEFIDLMLSEGDLFLASKCVNKTSDEIKEKLCALLADKMDSRYKLEKRNSMQSLVRIGTTGIGIIAEALKDEDKSVQWIAAQTLENTLSETAVQPLINALNEDSDVRWIVAEVLGNIKHKTAGKPLINVLKDKDINVMRIVAEPLENIKDEDKNVMMIAAEVFENTLSETAVQPLINALKDEDKNVQRIVAAALGKIKSETAVQPLINALKDEDSDVRWTVAEALGNIKSETAVKPLINALKDEDSDVRWKAAEALGNIKSDIAVQPLINVLKDESEYVRWTVAEALGNICTVKNKKQLEDLLASKHEFSVNTAFEILYEIEKKVKSEIILFEKQPYRITKVDGHGNTQKIEHVRPADEGPKDAYFGIFVDKLKSIQEPTIIIDYGCGEGKFLSAMTTLPDSALENISYVGVDLLTRCRYMSRLAAEKYGLFEKFRNEPVFFKPKAFLKKDFLADYVFFMHVLHEIELVYLPDIIYSLSNKVKNGGKIFVLDQKELVEKERSFVLWDDERDFGMLFKDSGFKPYVRYFKTGSGKQLSSIEIEKVEDKCFTREDARRNCLAAYKAKQERLSKKRKTSGPSDEEYSEISIQYTNISEQIADYERTLHSEMN